MSGAKSITALNHSISKPASIVVTPGVKLSETASNSNNVKWWEFCWVQYTRQI